MDKNALFNCEKTDLEVYYCKNCNFKADIKIFFWYHLEKVHLRRKYNLDASECAACYLCENCNFSTYSLLHLYKHDSICQKNIKKKKQSYKYQCPDCFYNVPQRWVLKQHIIKKHTPLEKIKWHKCNYCDYKGKLQKDLREHLRKYHKSEFEEDLLFCCDLCEFKSKTKENIKIHTVAKHTAQENERKYKCDKCEFKTVYKTSLKHHILRRHTDSEEIQWHQCEHCIFKAKMKRDLTVHVNLQHKKNPQEYKCNTCNFKTIHKSNFGKHMKTKMHKIQENNKHF